MSLTCYQIHSQVYFQFSPGFNDFRVWREPSSMSYVDFPCALNSRNKPPTFRVNFDSNAHVLKYRTTSVSGECRELAFPAFFFFANKRLVKHNIRTVDVRNMGACELLCYREPNCVSINFQREATAEGKFRCDLNNATHRGHDDEFVDTEGYFYRGAQV